MNRTPFVRASTLCEEDQCSHILGVNHSAVSRIAKRFRYTRSYYRKRVRSRKKVTSASDEHF